MILRFEGAPPDEGAVAAIVAVLEMHRDSGPAQASSHSAWQLSARFPELTFDEVRALAQSGAHVS